MRRIALIAVAAGVALTAAVPAQALVPADVALVAGATSSIVSVSPDVYYDEATRTYYLYTTGMRIGVFTSADGESWTEAPGASTPSGPYSDPSVVRMSDGTYRMYYAYRSGTGPGQPCSGKQLRYATSTDLVRWTPVSTTLLADLGCGVPNVVRLSDGTWRLYYVRGGPGLEHGTYLATSADGLVWNPTDTLLTPRDFVDPSVVQLSDGSWLMFTADFSSVQPPPPGFVQRLYVGTSENGLAWDFGDSAPLYAAPTGQGAFDPDAVVLPDGSVRIWWSQGTTSDNARVTAGTVTVTPDPGPDPAPVPVAPGKPTVTTGKAGIAVTWTYPPEAPSPDGYVVQAKTTKAWKDVAQVTGTSTSVRWAKVGAAKGRAFSVRVIAFIDEASATSAATKSTRPRR